MHVAKLYDCIWLMMSERTLPPRFDFAIVRGRIILSFLPSSPIGSSTPAITAHQASLPGKAATRSDHSSGEPSARGGGSELEMREGKGGRKKRETKKEETKQKVRRTLFCQLTLLPTVIELVSRYTDTRSCVSIFLLIDE